MKHQIKVYCKQEIPCNPCAASCVRGAIFKKTLTTPPIFDDEKCVGCLLCVANCPGQALFYINQEKGELIFPYEFVNRPDIGEIVNLVDEFGFILGLGEVVEYIEKKAFNKTTLIKVKGPVEFLEITRGIVKGE
ncbi:MAG: 4Fe-4S binding protein [Firmicutes bacterium]|nr:4Fe-4S binding protein [Bacillota bacterium]